jgi:hypothetical protein
MTGKRQDTITRINNVLPAPIELENHMDDKGVAHVTDVLVGDPIEVGDDAASYTVWTIRVTINHSTHSPLVLYKRYSEIEAFRNKLCAAHPTERIPMLPPKNTFSILRITMLPAWLEERRRGLQWFLTNVLLDPANQADVRDFLLAQ